MSDRQARIVVAGPVALIAAMIGVAASIALSDMTPALAAAPLAVLPVALCFWICADLGIGSKIILGCANLAIGAGVVAVLIGTTGMGIGALAFIVAQWGPCALVLAGTLGARVRSGSPLLGGWLLWWIPVVAGLVWTQPLALALTTFVGADGLAALPMFFAPILGMTAWAGAVGVAAVAERFGRGRHTGADSQARQSSEMA